MVRGDSGAYGELQVLQFYHAVNLEGVASV